MTYPISVFIIALNEADRIGRTIASVRDWVEEIIVIDSGSSDDTVAVATQHGAKVIAHAWQGYGPQKRFGEEQCRCDWLLNLDADEVVGAELAREIQEWFGHDIPAQGRVDGAELRIADCLPGESTPRRFAHVTRAVRLYDRRRGRYAASPVHDRVQFEHPPRLETFRGVVHHHSVRSIAHAIDKLNRYSTMQAEDMAKRGKTMRFLRLRLYTEWFTAFFKSYILRLDILRGRGGFINAVTYAFSRFARVAKVMEIMIGGQSTAPPLGGSRREQVPKE